jgi:hypothetical protein
MEFKGTKGKWSISNDKIVTSEEQDICIVDIYLEAYMDEENARQEVICKANTLLISKAPEMLDMLIRFVNSENTPIQLRKIAKQLIKEATEL